MIIGIAQIALIVRDYDEAKKFYCDILGFQVLEDTQLKTKRWVRLIAPGGQGCEIILSRATDEAQTKIIGNQAGGRVLFFLQTDHLQNDFARLSNCGVEFTEPIRETLYGKVAVFKDLYGNRIDLIEPMRTPDRWKEINGLLFSSDKDRLDIDTVHSFLKRTSWIAQRSRETLVRSIHNSYCFGAYDSGKQIAFARVVSDGCTFSYLCDVFVLEDYRGRGIAHTLMQEILAHPDLQSYRRFTLATQNAHGLYAQFGFKNPPDNVFMEIKKDGV